MKSIHPAIWLVAAFVYVVCPLDFDFVPVVGWCDDLVVAYAGIQKFRTGMKLRALR
jgi:uncharacterized membrane protein YkvA (DUF1232 family)